MNRIVAISTLALALAARARPAAADRLTFDAVVDIALSDSPDLAIANVAVSAANTHLESTRALYWPRVSVDGNALMWGSDIAFDIPVPCADDPATPANECPMGVALQSVTVRDRVTANAKVTATQGITPLWVIAEMVDADEAAVAVAEAERATARLEVAYRAAEGYVRLLQAQAARSIAETGVAQLEAHLERARALHDGGVLERVDVMRIEAALAEARQRAIAAARGVGIARDALIFTLGLARDADVDIADDLPATPPPPPALDGGAVDDAAEHRPEVAATRQRVAQARAAARIEQLQRLPRVYAVATYQRTEGGGTFQAADDWFVGVTLQWDAWDWGHQRKRAAAAALDAERAKLAAARHRDRVRLEIARAAADARSAYGAVAVAAAGLTAAEEAFRIRRERFDAGALTATDLLDAETEVTRARLGYASARYDYYLALVALARATGRLPGPFVTGGK
ncbi:MAG: TolC family protein [Deltaproteobacteria bacterium]|nr:MAG: TolC family protein [Deltaproteobacteria bacterium]